MTVKELKKKLKGVPGDYNVVVNVDSYDVSDTVCKRVSSVVVVNMVESFPPASSKKNKVVLI